MSTVQGPTDVFDSFAEEPMNVRCKAARFLFLCALALVLAPVIAFAQGRTVRITGVVRDEANAIALPGVPVEVVGANQVVYTDVDGRYALQVPAGKHQIKVLIEGYQERLINVEAGDERTITADVGLTMTKLTETVVVNAQAVDLSTSSAEAQLIERKQAPVITDNVDRKSVV